MKTYSQAFVPKRILWRIILLVLVLAAAVGLAGGFYLLYQNHLVQLAAREQDAYLIGLMSIDQPDDMTSPSTSDRPSSMAAVTTAATIVPAAEPTAIPEPVILPKYEQLYAENSDLAGWLTIAGTKINYPVMQTPADEVYYLTRGFDKAESKNGCLLMDTDSTIGSGTKGSYTVSPCTNLIIHGHNMKSGQMFGDLDLYLDQAYELEHAIIGFDSLFEKREYEIIAVFQSKVYLKTDDVFKFYKFFNAENQAQFDYFYSNIKGLALYDTAVAASFGDELITLSTCSYHTKNGRLVVVGKRIK